MKVIVFTYNPEDIEMDFWMALRNKKNLNWSMREGLVLNDGTQASQAHTYDVDWEATDVPYGYFNEKSMFIATGEISPEYKERYIRTAKIAEEEDMFAVSIELDL